MATKERHVLASRTNRKDVSALLLAAREGDRQRLGALLHLYRDYLHALASRELNSLLRRRVSPSDVVQDAMLGAFRDFDDFRGESEQELVGWLRRILINRLHQEYDKHVQAGCRDLRREVSLDQAGKATGDSEDASARLFIDSGKSPSWHVSDREGKARLAHQLAQLRPDYREVIMLRNLQGLSFDLVAERMDRKPGAVRMLWLRAIEKLRQTCEESA
jgi:RNA polymerase sigma-70 factor (ECF subfamily)